MNVKKILYLLTFLVAGLVFASSTEGQQKPEKYNPVPDIMHHISDSHSWHFWGEGENSVSISLPIILLDNGLKVFSSAKFGHHEDEVAEVDGNYYKLYHNKIYKTDAAGTLNMHEDHPTNAKPLDFSITKVVAQMLLAAVILILIAFATRGSYRKSQVPSGIARFIEPLIIFVRDEIALQNIGSVKYKRFVPYLVTLFLFIWLMNILGLLPGSANVTGNIAFTMVMAVLTFIIVNVNGRKTYWSHIFDPLGNNMPWAGKLLVYVILVPVEILGMFTKPIALMIRLFANMTAGHIVILSLVSLIFIMQSYAVAPVSVALTLFINVLEVLVAALQAYIFTLLTALFIGMAVEEPHHAH
ncbi:F0F1 ATP synthase subunit A [Elizabethkingia anophelis]|uniref:F0F1 ATP synthase subunit A n=1 Tax=Elizabethkingia anophelis TaxID=1117645 RepID=UPI000389DD79|nr:F0F1 ATP synthase subunit A [Elizabethkingia anophelis]EQB90737.1 ATP synthase F0 subunit A [Elizabethkingia anophelis 502]MCT3734536.1 F0F1 ATP synthase subunit A [Elizabethkingia anophelis]MCT3958658.1 F0F1 ATP synthase subunit A [Elizabethkingia anophelis]